VQTVGTCVCFGRGGAGVLCATVGTGVCFWWGLNGVLCAFCGDTVCLVWGCLKSKFEMKRDVGSIPKFKIDQKIENCAFKKKLR
jgi:hypothetical protein